jgi:hypothetical protein
VVPKKLVDWGSKYTYISKEDEKQNIEIEVDENLDEDLFENANLNDKIEQMTSPQAPPRPIADISMVAPNAPAPESILKVMILFFLCYLFLFFVHFYFIFFFVFVNSKQVQNKLYHDNNMFKEEIFFLVFSMHFLPEVVFFCHSVHFYLFVLVS